MPPSLLFLLVCHDTFSPIPTASAALVSGTKGFTSISSEVRNIHKATFLVAGAQVWKQVVINLASDGSDIVAQSELVNQEAVFGKDIDLELVLVTGFLQTSLRGQAGCAEVSAVRWRSRKGCGERLGG